MGVYHFSLMVSTGDRCSSPAFLLKYSLEKRFLEEFMPEP